MTNTLSINQISTLRWDIRQDAEEYAQRGWDGIGLYRPKLDEIGIDRTVELLAENALEVTSLSWAGGFTGSDGRPYQDAVVDGIDAIRDAANLNASTLIVLAGGRNNHIRRHARRTLCEALRRLAPVAEEFGVSLAIEPFHVGCGLEWSFLNDLESTLAIIEAIDSDALGMVLDTYHVGMDESMMSWLPHVIDHVRLLQLGDGRHSPLGEMNRCLLGQGCVPIDTMVRTALAHDYRGPIEIEVIGEDVEPLDYDDVLDHTRLYIDRQFDAVGS